MKKDEQAGDNNLHKQAGKLRSQKNCRKKALLRNCKYNLRLQNKERSHRDECRFVVYRDIYNYSHTQ